MRKKLVIIAICIISSSLLYSNGSLLIICEPGFRVYVDDEFKGFTSSEQDGLFLENLETGNHKVTLKKSNFVPKIINVLIEDNKIIEKEVKYFTEMTFTEEKNNDSNNEEISIRLDGYYKTNGIQKHDGKIVYFYICFQNKNEIYIFGGEKSCNSKESIIRNVNFWKNFGDNREAGLPKSDYYTYSSYYSIKGNKIIIGGEEIVIIDCNNIQFGNLYNLDFIYTGED